MRLMMVGMQELLGPMVIPLLPKKVVQRTSRIVLKRQITTFQTLNL